MNPSNISLQDAFGQHTKQINTGNRRKNGTNVEILH